MLSCIRSDSRAEGGWSPENPESAGVLARIGQAQEKVGGGPTLPGDLGM